MEKLVKREIVIHWIENKLFSDSQHGFVLNKSFTTNLLESLDMMTKILDSKVEMDLIFLDIAKAFDKVNHHLLAFKLEKRKQRVVMGEVVSVSIGIPQGSVLTCLKRSSRHVN